MHKILIILLFNGVVFIGHGECSVRFVFPETFRETLPVENVFVDNSLIDVKPESLVYNTVSRSAIKEYQGSIPTIDVSWSKESSTGFGRVLLKGIYRRGGVDTGKAEPCRSGNILGRSGAGILPSESDMQGFPHFKRAYQEHRVWQHPSSKLCLRSRELVIGYPDQETRKDSYEKIAVNQPVNTAGIMDNFPPDGLKDCTKPVAYLRFVSGFVLWIFGFPCLFHKKETHDKLRESVLVRIVGAFLLVTAMALWGMRLSTFI